MARVPASAELHRVRTSRRSAGMVSSDDEPLMAVVPQSTQPVFGTLPTWVDESLRGSSHRQRAPTIQRAVGVTIHPRCSGGSGGRYSVHLRRHLACRLEVLDWDVIKQPSVVCDGLTQLVMNVLWMTQRCSQNPQTLFDQTCGPRLSPVQPL